MKNLILNFLLSHKLIHIDDLKNEIPLEYNEKVSHQWVYYYFTKVVDHWTYYSVHYSTKNTLNNINSWLSDDWMVTIHHCHFDINKQYHSLTKIK